DEVRAIAEEAHEADALTLRRHLGDLDVEPTRTRLEVLRVLLRQVDSLGPRPEPSGGPELTDPQGGYDSALIALEQAVSAHENAKGQVNALASAADEARTSDEASERSERAWRRYFL